jgi:hypothetical protein
VKRSTSTTLYYDPSLGLGLLLGGSKDTGSKTSSSSSFLVVVVAVAVAIAVVVVVVGMISGTVALKRKQRRNSKLRRSAQIIGSHARTMMELCFGIFFRFGCISITQLGSLSVLSLLAPASALVLSLSLVSLLSVLTYGERKAMVSNQIEA